MLLLRLIGIIWCIAIMVIGATGIGLILDNWIYGTKYALCYTIVR